jgi:acyl carrier protein
MSDGGHLRDGKPPPITLDLAVEAVRRVLPARRRDAVALTADVRFEEDLGLSSLDVGEAFVRLEELVGRPLDTSWIEQTRTIGDLLLVQPASEDRAW